MKRSYFSIAFVLLMAAWITGCGTDGPINSSSEVSGPSTGQTGIGTTGSTVNGQVANVSVAGADAGDPSLLGSVVVGNRSLVVTNRTRIFSGGQEVSFDALEKGQQVIADFTGQGREYLPATATATKITILVPRSS